MASKVGTKTRSQIREFDLIRTLQQRHGRKSPSVIRGIGDDAAVVTSGAGRWSVLTTDLLAEGIHFDLRTATMADIGFRAAAANLSDIAAMGATPQYILVALAIPRTGTNDQVQQLYRGMMAACRPHHVELIGGDTSASDGGWFISVTLVGMVPPRKALFRNGADIGDRLYVTGTIGDSLAGLMLLNERPPRKTQRPGTAAFSPRHRRFLTGRHLRPTARIPEGQWLSSHRLATAAIDISDGLSGDLRHICDESHVGVELDLGALPLSPACRAYAAARQLDPVALALTGGEDYELLFTLSPRHQAQAERAAKTHRFRITCIGIVRPARHGILAVGPEGKKRPLPITSYEHFR
ncbi:MAG: thiamine-phosphate kinase [Nitrospirota bacterium]|nr:thiamine-phosphate kinase [Nitrospirota bacterium]MDP3595592.1 thiamine-phosphate kinase [Nitrospirota bacterium]